MLYTKFRQNRHIDSGEDFKRVLPYIGHSGHLCYATKIILISYHLFVPKHLHTFFLISHY